MPKPSEYDKTHLRNMAAVGTRIDRIFKKAADEAAKIGVSIHSPLPDGRIFAFDDYPETHRQIERLLTALWQSTEGLIVNSVRSAWTLSNNKNNALVSRIFGDRFGSLSKEQQRRYFSTNGAALDAFLQRREQGLNLSDRVWRYTSAFKHEIEMGLDLGIRSGRSAAQMSRDLRQYLQHPDKLFRRIRDQHGHLRLSQAAAAFHPGRGVYRSSYRNARRLAVTETNIAYRTADHLRWQQMDFVVGIRIVLSNNHTLGGIAFTDICDRLSSTREGDGKGLYPKDFKFVGWHPHCRCHAVAVLKTEEEMAEDTQRIVDGEQPTTDSVNTVRDIPLEFKEFLSDFNARNVERAAMGLGPLATPYFISDNGTWVTPVFALEDTITVGGLDLRVKDLIAECRVYHTERGKVYLHPKHGRGELAENIEFARWRAEQFGEEVILLPNPQNIKTADSYNITRGVMEEYKRCSTPTISAVDNALRSASHQADYIIIEPGAIKPHELTDAINNRSRRTTFKELRVRIGDSEAVYTREQILTKGFKIQPGDFRMMRLSPGGQGAWSVATEPITDAKLIDFFGLGKKSAREISAARHTARTAADIEDIKRRWEARCRNPLVIAANRHTARSAADVKRIQAAWDVTMRRHALIRSRAEAVFKVARSFEKDIDPATWLTMGQAIAKGDLMAMRRLTKPLGTEIKGMQTRLKALKGAGLVADVDGAHATWSLADLEAVQASIQKQLAGFKAKGYGDFALDTDLANLQKLKQSLLYQAKLAAKSQGKYATWEVAEKSWLRLADKAQDLIEWQPIKAQVAELATYKTKSGKFANFLEKAQAAIAAGNKEHAQAWLQNASATMKKLEAAKAKRGVATGTTVADLYDGGVPFSTAELAKIQDYEARILDMLMKSGSVSGSLNEEYHDYICALCEKYYSRQKSLYSAAEQAAMQSSAEKYMAREAWNPRFVWGADVGGIYKGRYQKRHAYLKKLGQAARDKGLSGDQLSIVQRFTNGSTFSNAYNLRHTSLYWANKWESKMASLTTAEQALMEQVIEEWSQGANFVLDRLVRYNGVTFRGLDGSGGPELRAQLLNAFKTGTPWVNKASCSTSMKFSVADRFDGDLIMVIHNKTGAYIHPMSDYGTEYEIMTLRGAKYRVIKPPTFINGRYVVELEEI